MSGRTFLGTASVSPTPVELSQHRRSLKALTGVRFFAAVDVVILHTRLPTALIEHGYHALGTFFLNGSLAVALFFLLSGFILSYTYQGQLQKPSGFRRFWEARFARIWPVYAASLLFTSAVSLSFPKPSWILPTLLMVQAWDPVHYAMWGAWNFVCWTISAEAFFYLCFPWIQILIERLTTRRLLLLMRSSSDADRRSQPKRIRAGLRLVHLVARHLSQTPAAAARVCRRNDDGLLLPSTESGITVGSHTSAARGTGHMDIRNDRCDGRAHV